MINAELVTASYWSYRPGMGVPVRTSVGRHKDFAHAEEALSLAPWGVFKRLADLPLPEQAERYKASLTKRQDRIWRELASITTCYPGYPLVLLCWCSPGTALAGGCHRRWAAEWFMNEWNLDVVETV